MRAVGSAYDVDEVELLASGAYAKELLAARRAAGVAMFEEDDRLLCYPSIVRVLPADLALEIDRRRARGIRPSVVVAQLARRSRRARGSSPHRSWRVWSARTIWSSRSRARPLAPWYGCSTCTAC